MTPTSRKPTPTRRGIAVTTRKELEATFDDLSQGDTVYVSAENAPYRTTQWLDIDVDGVNVVGPGVRTLIEPANGANVGGIRIGHNQRCREIDIRGVGYHGNPEGQSRSASRLHGIAVRNARNVTITRNQIRQTRPRRHGDGGSGISVAQPCSGLRIFDNRIFGNVGFGSHKSFCHLRGPAALQNISVQNNVSLQETDQLRTEETTKFSGIAIDVFVDDV